MRHTNKTDDTDKYGTCCESTDIGCDTGLSEVQDQLDAFWRLYTILAHLAHHFTSTSIDLEPI